MDITSYLLGKNSSGGGGGGSLDQYFNTFGNGTQSYPGILLAIKETPQFEFGEGAEYAFKGCENLETANLQTTANVTDMYYMFSGCRALKNVSIKSDNVQYTQNMFESCVALVEAPQLNMSKVIKSNQMFKGCTSLTTIPAYDMSSATDMSGMFQSCYNFTNDTLNNILAMCASATNYAKTKTSSAIGLYSGYNTRMTNCANYQAFLDAGWSLS